MWDDFGKDSTEAPNARLVTMQTSFYLARTAWVSIDLLKGLVGAAGAVLGRAQTPTVQAAGIAVSLWDNLLGLLPVLVSSSETRYGGFVRTLGAALERAVQRVGLAGGDAMTAQLRQALYSLAVFAKDSDAVVGVLGLFSQSPNSVCH